MRKSRHQLVRDFPNRGAKRSPQTILQRSIATATARPHARERESRMSRLRSRKRRARFGAAAVELAVLLPFLAFLFVIAVDWSRIFYYSVIVTNAARNGALYASDPTTQSESPYAN